MKFKSIISSDDNIISGKIKMSEADEKQSNLLNSISKFNDKDRPESKKEKEEKSSTYESVNDLDEGRELTLNTFISDIFPLKSKQGKGYP